MEGFYNIYFLNFWVILAINKFCGLVSQIVYHFFSFRNTSKSIFRSSKNGFSASLLLSVLGLNIKFRGPMMRNLLSTEYKIFKGYINFLFNPFFSTHVSKCIILILFLFSGYAGYSVNESGNLTINSGSYVSRNTSITWTSGSISVNGGTLEIFGDLNINSGVTLNFNSGYLLIHGSLIYNGNLTVNGTVEVDNNLIVNGSYQGNGSALTVVDGNMSTTSVLGSDGDLVVAGNFTTNGNIVTNNNDKIYVFGSSACTGAGCSIINSKAQYFAIASPPGQSYLNIARYSMSGSFTFTVPSGVIQITVECWGGGGAGGRATETGNNDAAGGGGAGGAYAKKTIGVNGGDVFTINVAGSKSSITTSNAGSNNNGYPSVVLSGITELVKAMGGAGGSGSSDKSTSGTGGLGTESGSIGDVTYAGGNGANGYNSYRPYSGAGGGGAGSTGIGGNANTISGGVGTSISGGNGGNGINNTSTVGNNGVSYGGGGSGALHSSNVGALAGGNGAQGLVIITWTTSCTAPAAPTGTASQSFCSSSSPKVSDIVVVGSNIIWYTASTGGTVVAGTTALASGTTYYASQTTNGCESTSRLAVNCNSQTQPPQPPQEYQARLQSVQEAQTVLTATGGSEGFRGYL